MVGHITSRIANAAIRRRYYVGCNNINKNKNNNDGNLHHRCRNCYLNSRPFAVGPMGKKCSLATTTRTTTTRTTTTKRCSLLRLLSLQPPTSVLFVPTKSLTATIRTMTTTASTYYDSQSGLHLPIHNEKEIKLFLTQPSLYNQRHMVDDGKSIHTATATNDSIVKTSRSSPLFEIPFHFYKESGSSNDDNDDHSTLVDQITYLQANFGIHGIILFPSQTKEERQKQQQQQQQQSTTATLFPRDIRNLQSISNLLTSYYYSSSNELPSGEQTNESSENNDIRVPPFTIFVPVPNSCNALSPSLSTSNIIHQVVQLDDGNKNDDMSSNDDDSDDDTMVASTSLFLSKSYHSKNDPMSVASRVAQWMDQTTRAKNTTATNDNNDSSSSSSSSPVMSSYGNYLIVSTSSASSSASTHPNTQGNNDVDGDDDGIHDDDDDEIDIDHVIELCEELMYLDVAGPTIQSRLIIDLSSILSRNNKNSKTITKGLELMDELMLLGINKYIISTDTATGLNNHNDDNNDANDMKKEDTDDDDSDNKNTSVFYQIEQLVKQQGKFILKQKI